MPNFSQAILIAVETRGFSNEQVGRAISASGKRLKAIATGRFELSDREVERIEEMTERTGGQLALEGSGLPDGGLLEVFDAWADFKHALKASGSVKARARRRA